MTASCSRLRRLGSAVADGEASAVEAATWERHLESCAACRSWAQAERELRAAAAGVGVAPRPMRRRPTTAVDEAAAAGRLTGEGPPRPAARRRVLALRWLLAALAVAQLVTALLPLLSGSHDGHETGAADIAVAVGVLVVAWRPSRASGLVAVLGAFALLLLATAAADVLRGEVHPAHEVPHVLVLAEAAAVVLLRRMPILTGGRGPGHARRLEDAA